MQTVTKQTLKIYWQHTKRYKGVFILVIFCIFATTVIDVVRPILLKNFFNLATGTDADKIKEMLLVVWYLLGLGLLGQGFWRTAGYGVNYFQPRVMSDLLNTCYEYLLDHSYGFFNNNFIGSIVTRTRRYQNSYERVSDNFIWNFFRTTLLILFTMAVLFYLRPFLGFLVLIWCIVYLGLAYGFTRWKLKYDIQSAEQDTKTTAHLADTLTNNINLKLFTSQKAEIRSFRIITDRLFHLRRHTWNLGNHFEIFQSIDRIAGVCRDV